MRLDLMQIIVVMAIVGGIVALGLTAGRLLRWVADNVDKYSDDD